MSIPVLFNIDCNTLLNLVFPPERREHRFTIANMTDFIDLLAVNGVNTVLMNANGQPPWYPSKRVAPIYHGYTRGDRDFVRPHFPMKRDGTPEEPYDAGVRQMMDMLDRCLDLEEDGIDWLAEVAARCRHHGMAPWVSIRMNDAHGGNSWEGSFFNCPLQRDPAYRLSGAGYDPSGRRNHFYQLLDYRHPEVRQYYLDIIADALIDHDFAGLELDWLRMPLCCEPPASAESYAAVHDLFTRVRALADQKADQLGQHVPVSVRTPIQLGFMRQIGLDFVALAHDGLIDAIAPSNFWQSSWDVDYATLRDRLPASTQLIGVIEDAPNWVPCRNATTGRERYRLLSTTASLVRGNAANKLISGCDAIEFYNFFCSDAYSHGRNPDSSKRQADYPAMRRLTDFDFLRRQPLQYSLQNMYGPFDFPMFENADQLPATINAGQKRPFRIAMIAQPDSRVIVDIVSAEPASLGLSLNQSWPIHGGESVETLIEPVGEFTHHVHPATRFELPGAALQDGWNDLLIFNNGSADVQILGLDIATKL